MPEDSVVVKSLAYRKNEDAIWRGKVPDKYARILPHIPGRRIIEIGAAEGVLALLLADRGRWVLAVERREERHNAAVQLQARWAALGRKVDGCKMIKADIIKSPELLQGMDCLVGVRVIYHLREAAKEVIAAASAANVRHVLLCGNKNRAERFNAGAPDEGLGEWNYYSTIKGMSELLKNAGYRIEKIISDGDPIVLGAHRSHQAG